MASTDSASSPAASPGPTAAAAALARTPGRGWLVLMLFRFQDSSAGITGLAFGVMLPFIREDLRLTSLDAGLLQMVNWIVPALLSVPLAGVLTRFRPTGLVFLSTLLSLPFIFVQGLAFNFITMFLPRLLFSAGRVAATYVRTLMMQQWASPRDFALINALALSLHSVLIAVSFGTMALLIGALGSWRLGFVVLGAFMAVQLVVWRPLASEKRAPVQTLVSSLKEPLPPLMKVVRAYPRVWPQAIVLFAMGATWSAMVTFLPTFLLDERGVSLKLGGPLVAFLYFGIIPTAPFGGLISRKVRNPKALLAGTALLNTLVALAIVATPNPIGLMALMLALGAVWARRLTF